MTMGLYEFYRARHPGEKKFYDFVPVLVEKKYLKTMYKCHECAGTLRGGDIDGDGVDEAAVVMWESGGGSGAFYFLCIVKKRKGKPACIATSENTFGDRIEVDSVKVTRGKVVMKGLISDDNDASCCPMRPGRITCTMVRGKKNMKVKVEKLKPLTPSERAEVEKRYHGP